jgi:Cdc6-like AAA superfamily ATPase
MEALLEFVLNHSSLLHSGAFEGQNGSHARVLVGAPGTGKSFLLRHYAEVCELVFPSLVPVYITCDRWKDSNEVTLSVLQVAAQELKKRGLVQAEDIVGASSPGHLPLLVERVLTTNNRKLLLIVDELDMLYRLQPRGPYGDREAFAAASRSIDELAGLGDQTSGLVSAGPHRQ